MISSLAVMMYFTAMMAVTMSLVVFLSLDVVIESLGVKL